jgi:hypothetical protein
MMGRLDRGQCQLFYAFDLEEAVPQDHLVRGIAEVLDLSWMRAALAPQFEHRAGHRLAPNTRNTPT